MVHCKANSPKACSRKMTHWQDRKATPDSSHVTTRQTELEAGSLARACGAGEISGAGQRPG